MALIKWFLCGGHGAAGGPDVVEAWLRKGRGLALTFADKAVKKGLPSAEFAMGYYAEVGVGCPGDIKTAVGWNQLVCSRFLYHLFFSPFHPLFRLTNTVTRMPQCGSRCYQNPVNPYDSITENLSSPAGLSGVAHIWTRLRIIHGV
jgi:hypothetical protein